MARELKVSIVGDSRSLERALGRSSSATSSFGRTIGRGLASAARIGVIGMAGLAAGGALLGKKMIGLASDAGEVQSKMEVVFGKALPDLTKNVDAFAKATGASRFELREQVANMGALLEPLTKSKQGAADMSFEFTKLAVDLGSFNNVPVAQALEAIRSGLVGEATPLRQFGVLLNEAAVNAEGYRLGLAKVGEKLTEQEKVQARASLIMKQTTLAQGDATRTAGSMANQLKELKNSISDAGTALGQVLIPFALSAVSAFNEHVVPALGKTVEFIQKIASAPSMTLKLRVLLEGARGLIDQIMGLLLGGTGKELVADVDFLIKPRTVKTEGLIQKLGDALAAINWGPVGARLSEALAASLEAGGVLAGKLTNGIVRAVGEVDWVAVGKEIATGFKSGLAQFGKEVGPKGGQGFFEQTVRSALFLGPTLLGIIEDDAKAAGKQSGKGVKAGANESLGPLSGVIALLVIKAVQGARQAQGEADASGRAVGGSLKGGIEGGLAGVASSVASQIIGAIRSAIAAVRGAFQMESPSGTTKEQIGVPLGQGIVVGFLLGSAPLPSTMAAKVKEAIEKGRQAIQSSRSEFETAFSELASAALAAFDRVTDTWVSPARALLEKMDFEERAKSIQQAVSDAIKNLNDISAGVGFEPKEGESAEDAVRRQEAQAKALLEAQKTYNEAVRNQGRSVLEQVALDEEKAHAAKRERERVNFENRLEKLKTELALEGAAHKEAHKKVMALYKQFGIDYAKSGKILGAAIVEGLRDSLSDVEAAAREIANIIKKYLRLRSPAEKGPLKDLDHWADSFGTTYAQGLRRGMGSIGNVSAALSGAMTPRVGGSLSMGGGGAAMAGASGGGVHYHTHIHVDGIFGNDDRNARELARKVEPYLHRGPASISTR